jgi:hypothetical protein
MFPTASNSEMAPYLYVPATTLSVSGVVVSKYEYQQPCPQDIYVFPLFFYLFEFFLYSPHFTAFLPGMEHLSPHCTGTEIQNVYSSYSVP